MEVSVLACFYEGGTAGAGKVLVPFGAGTFLLMKGGDKCGLEIVFCTY